MKLVDTKTKEEIHIGDTVMTFRGEQVVVRSFNERRVYVRTLDGQDTSSDREYFHSVIGAEVQA